MKVSGFTFIKDALTYDYPILEAIYSILPLCDEVVVAVGRSEDQTLDLIRSINTEKIRIVETVWDENLRSGGVVLAKETDKAFQEVSPDADWAIYIQGDEVIHEKFLPTIRQNMERYKDAPEVDGLLLKYLHFYGSYDYVGTSSNWYKNEIRIVKNDKTIYSYRDAQGFRKDENQKLNVIPIDAFVYHYGWVKEPAAMQRKQENFNRYWHNDQWIDENVHKSETFDYEKHVSTLRLFEGTHPKVMEDRIKKKNWKFGHDISFDQPSLKDKLKASAKKYLGLDFSYRNYNIIKPKT